jgi:hypothetical protein
MNTKFIRINANHCVITFILASEKQQEEEEEDDDDDKNQQVCIRMAITD